MTPLVLRRYGGWAPRTCILVMSPPTRIVPGHASRPTPPATQHNTRLSRSLAMLMGGVAPQRQTRPGATDHGGGPPLAVTAHTVRRVAVSVVVGRCVHRISGSIEPDEHGFLVGISRLLGSMPPSWHGCQDGPDLPRTGRPAECRSDLPAAGRGPAQRRRGCTGAEPYSRPQRTERQDTSTGPGGSTSLRVHDRQGPQPPREPPDTTHIPGSLGSAIRTALLGCEGGSLRRLRVHPGACRAAKQSAGPPRPRPIRTLGATRRRARVDLVSRACPGPRARRRTAPHQSAYPPRHARLDLVALIDRDGPRSRKQCPAAARASRQAPAVMTSQPQRRSATSRSSPYDEPHPVTCGVVRVSRPFWSGFEPPLHGRPHEGQLGWQPGWAARAVAQDARDRQQFRGRQVR